MSTIFISSRFTGLAYLRDAIKLRLEDDGHEVRDLNDGEAYSGTAEQRSRDELLTCDVVLMLLGDTYGDLWKDDKSLTELEYEWALDAGIPILAFSPTLGPDADPRAVALRSRVRSTLVSGWLAPPDKDPRGDLERITRSLARHVTDTEQNAPVGGSKGLLRRLDSLALVGRHARTDASGLGPRAVHVIERRDFAVAAVKAGDLAVAREQILLGSKDQVPDWASAFIGARLALLTGSPRELDRARDRLAGAMHAVGDLDMAPAPARLIKDRRAEGEITLARINRIRGSQQSDPEALTTALEHARAGLALRPWSQEGLFEQAVICALLDLPEAEEAMLSLLAVYPDDVLHMLALVPDAPLRRRLSQAAVAEVDEHHLVLGRGLRRERSPVQPDDSPLRAAILAYRRTAAQERSQIAELVRSVVQIVDTATNPDRDPILVARDLVTRTDAALARAKQTAVQDVGAPSEVSAADGRPLEPPVPRTWRTLKAAAVLAVGILVLTALVAAGLRVGGSDGAGVLGAGSWLAAAVVLVAAAVLGWDHMAARRHAARLEAHDAAVADRAHQAVEEAEAECARARAYLASVITERHRAYMSIGLGGVSTTREAAIALAARVRRYDDAAIARPRLADPWVRSAYTPTSVAGFYVRDPEHDERDRTPPRTGLLGTQGWRFLRMTDGVASDLAYFARDISAASEARLVAAVAETQPATIAADGRCLRCGRYTDGRTCAPCDGGYDVDVTGPLPVARPAASKVPLVAAASLVVLAGVLGVRAASMSPDPVRAAPPAPAAPPVPKVSAQAVAPSVPVVAICPGSRAGRLAQLGIRGVTSCEFAEAVRANYLTLPHPTARQSVTATSPKTHQTYSMACTGTTTVTCVGGNQAVVVFTDTPLITS